jgi:xylan 1,4-beta-xylosidase
MEERIGHRHDPSLFRDDDGTFWMIWGAAFIAPLRKDLTDFAAAPSRIAPSDRPIGHEGCCIRMIGGKYVLFGTGWSADTMRKGTYNLNYCVADQIAGPCGERQFAGRFLGHGIPIQDKQGRWWSTAFYNANKPPVEQTLQPGARLDDTATIINPQGVTIVPLAATLSPSGAVRIRAKVRAYAIPGAEEVQKFPD